MKATEKLKLALVDDYVLFRKGLISLIQLAYRQSEILFEADNGIDLQNKLDAKNLPDIILVDVNMPGMDGFATMQWLSKTYPQIKVLVVSMIEKEETVVRMLKLGAKGYLCKDVEPDELAKALEAIAKRGVYYTDFVTGKLIHSLQEGERPPVGPEITLNAQERKFVELACSELTYSEIADQMCLSPKTVDGYRSVLFDKLNVKSRVGLVLYAIRHRLVKLDVAQPGQY